MPLLEAAITLIVVKKEIIPQVLLLMRFHVSDVRH